MPDADVKWEPDPISDGRGQFATVNGCRVAILLSKNVHYRGKFFPEAWYYGFTPGRYPFGPVSTEAEAKRLVIKLALAEGLARGG
jgi:hypothetical protein